MDWTGTELGKRDSSILVDVENNEPKDQEKEPSIWVDVENNGAIIELRNGECGDNESTKLGSTVPTEMEIKQLPPANNSQDEML